MILVLKDKHPARLLSLRHFRSQGMLNIHPWFVTLRFEPKGSPGVADNPTELKVAFYECVEKPVWCVAGGSQAPIDPLINGLHSKNFKMSTKLY